ncbi:hypothetical protein KUV80_08320 [Fictibacillus nanhaiensis]|uniref:hypothetical protein n=1 Tax=Fictibacillus nanhaiensis TaxID=742169 RepID=UPI001C93E108|nr:hypothetical protein [Fictibacillus nanhaiensis]MBY6036655.1 hypothetical protein [Fictibacillus nanhaiensis]
MKKIIAAAFLVFLTACSGNGVVEQLKEDYPEVKKVAEQLPETVQERLAAPEELPFEPKNVELMYAGDLPGDPKGDIVHTEFVYGDGEATVLHVTTFQNKNSSFSGDGAFKTTKLKDGTEVVIETDTPNAKSIRWKKDDLYYGISVVTDSEKEITIKDLVKAANSMEY